LSAAEATPYDGARNSPSITDVVVANAAVVAFAAVAFVVVAFAAAASAVVAYVCC